MLGGRGDIIGLFLRAGTQQEILVRTQKGDMGMNTSLMLLNSTVGETFSTIQQLSFFQESIVHAYRNPILATLLFLNVAVIPLIRNN